MFFKKLFFLKSKDNSDIYKFIDFNLLPSGFNTGTKAKSYYKFYHHKYIFLYTSDKFFYFNK